MKVVVVGLLPSQTKFIKKRCPAVDFKFIEVDKSIHFPSADHVVLVTRFVNHQWSREAYARFPRKKVHLHPSGLTELTNLIKELR